MMNHTNKIIDVTADVEHMLAISFDTTIQEVNEEVGNKVFKIVSILNKNHTIE